MSQLFVAQSEFVQQDTEVGFPGGGQVLQLPPQSKSDSSPFHNPSVQCGGVGVGTGVGMGVGVGVGVRQGGITGVGVAFGGLGIGVGVGVGAGGIGVGAGVGTGVNTQKVWKVYNDLIDKFGNEMKIALDVSEDKLKKIAPEKVVDLIMRNRGQKIEFQPGYDGEYGKPIFEGHKKQKPIAKPSQKGLGDFT